MLESKQISIKFISLFIDMAYNLSFHYIRKGLDNKFVKIEPLLRI